MSLRTGGIRDYRVMKSDTLKMYPCTDAFVTTGALLEATEEIVGVGACTRANKLPHIIDDEVLGNLSFKFISWQNADSVYHLRFNTFVEATHSTAIGQQRFSEERRLTTLTRAPCSSDRTRCAGPLTRSASILATTLT